MIAAGNRRAFGLATGLAVVMHLTLFIAVRPSSVNALSGPLEPPNTHYLAKAADALPIDGADARLVWSPLLFSLPSEMGFSRGLLRDDFNTPLPLAFGVTSESFLELGGGAATDGALVLPQVLMLTSAERMGPQLPGIGSEADMNRPSARRVYVAPELKERLEGGIVLPPELNQETDTAWEVRAAVSISGQGLVKHVFLDQPLESTELNQQVLRLLYGLRFKAGDAPVEGRIEIYSPESTPAGDTQP